MTTLITFFEPVRLFREADLEQSHPAAASLQAGYVQMPWRRSRQKKVQWGHRRTASWTEALSRRGSGGANDLAHLKVQ